MSASLSLLDAETGKLSLDWIVLTAVLLGTCASVLGSLGDDIRMTRPVGMSGSVLSADLCDRATASPAAATCAGP